MFLFLVPYVFTIVIGLGVAADAAGQSPREVAKDAGIGGLTAQAIVSGGAADDGQRFTTLIVAVFATFIGAKAA